MTHFNICLSQISFLHIYITYTRPFYILIFQFLKYQNKLLSILLHNKYITVGTVPHYAKHMNNIKVVHTKETIMTSNNNTKGVTQKQSTERCLKNTEQARRETPSPTCKPIESQEAITLKSQVPIGALPGTHRTSQEHPL